MALIILLFLHLILEVHSQNLPQPELSVSPAVITQRESVKLDCRAPDDVDQCYFYPEGQEEKAKLSPFCDLSLTGSELIDWTGRRSDSPEPVNITCYYSNKAKGDTKRSPHSPPAAVTILDAPQLRVTPAGRSSVHLNCTPQYPSVPQCDFYPEEEKKNIRPSSCQLLLTLSDLITWVGRSSSSLKPINIICYHPVKTSSKVLMSPNSLPATVKILGNKPKLTISHNNQRNEFTLECEIWLHQSLSADSRCNFYIGDESLLWKKSQKRESGSLICSSPASKTFLTGRIQKAKSTEVSCDYSLISEPAAHSPLSDLFDLKVMNLSVLVSSTTSVTMTSPTTIPSTTSFITSSITSSITTTKPTVTTASAVPTLPSKTTAATLITQSSPDEPLHKLSRREWLVLVLSVTSAGVILGVMVTCICGFYSKQQTGRNNVSSSGGTRGDMTAMKRFPDFTYSLITKVPTPAQPSDCNDDAENRPNNSQDNDLYHMYCSITDPAEL